jgi:hypothetical protein
VHFSAIVLRAEERVAAAQRALPERRWRIDDAPFRVIARVEKLLAATSLRSSRPSVSSAEGAVLLATPFIYETVLAAAETTLAAVGPVLDPLSIPESADGIPFWRAWGVACLNDELARHRYQTLVEQGYTEAASDFAGWCFNIFCHTAGELCNLLTAKEPDLVVKAAQEMRRGQEAESASKNQAAVTGNHDQLFDDPTAPVGGNPNGDVTVVEFSTTNAAIAKWLRRQSQSCWTPTRTSG